MPGPLATAGLPNSPPTCLLYLQVRLRHHAQVTQQDHRRQAVGTALDQELPVWGALVAHAPQLPLTAFQPVSAFFFFLFFFFALVMVFNY